MKINLKIKLLILYCEWTSVEADYFIQKALEFAHDQFNMT